jgi:hypothetical protein
MNKLIGRKSSKLVFATKQFTGEANADQPYSSYMDSTNFGTATGSKNYPGSELCPTDDWYLQKSFGTPQQNCRQNPWTSKGTEHHPAIEPIFPDTAR